MALHDCLVDDAPGALPAWLVAPETLPIVIDRWPAERRRWVEAAGFAAKAGDLLLVPGEGGALAGALFGLGRKGDSKRTLFLPGALAKLLPPGTWRFANEADDPRLAALAFALHAYRFDRYKPAKEAPVRLVVPGGVDGAALRSTVAAVAMARDLVNTPANDLGPEELAAAASALAAEHGAGCDIVTGAALESDFPLIYAVGKGSDRPPRLVDMTWGDPAHPKVTLVGKGVVFDTGGLDLKPAAGMLLMKKDMGGAATALALARLVMDAKLPVRLRVLLPVVENAVSGRSFRPLDVIRSRKGLTVEIGNTDAEGRLILADALSLADEDAPELLIDFSTLTGAARVALGPELSPFFTDDEPLAAALSAAGEAEHDPVWRLPLFRPYVARLDSKVADLNNVSGDAFAGAVIAALFLQRFVQAARSWLHFDIVAWNMRAGPGKPEGGELQAARAVFAVLRERYRG